MKTKLATILIAAACIAVSTPSQVRAQNPVPTPTPVSGETHKHHKFNPEKRLAHMTKRLDLTQAQQNQILPILQNEAVTVKTVRDDASLSEEQKHQQIRQSCKATRSQILAILTPDQQAKMHEKHEKQ